MTSARRVPSLNLSRDPGEALPSTGQAQSGCHGVCVRVRGSLSALSPPAVCP